VKPVLLDTGVIVALLDSSDSLHRPCVDAMANIATPLVTCEAVIAESCYLLRNVEGAAQAVLQNVAARNFLIPLTLSDSVRPVSRIMSKYRDRGIDLADACLVHLANEFGAGDILTVDRDFHIYRWGRSNPFRFLVAIE
jgi:uncharacterized protein